MSFSRGVLDFWEKVKGETGVTGGFADAWGFGDNPDLIDELLGYVLSGIKRTSTALCIETELEGWPEPKVGEFNIILDGRDKPVAVIRTVSARKVKYRDVDADHAFREHDKYYTRRGKALGFEFNRDMDVILERFELVYPI